MRKIRVEYEVRGEESPRIYYLTPEQVVGAFIKEFSSEGKRVEEIVLDIFRGIDPAATCVELELVERAVKALVKKGSSITEIVEKVLAPANELAQEWKEVLKKYCQRKIKVEDKKKGE